MNSRLAPGDAPDLTPDEQDRVTACLLELDSLAERVRTRHLLETDPRFAGAAESIAETLRVFSATAVAAPSNAETERAWARLRASLPPTPAPERPPHPLAVLLARLFSPLGMAAALAALLSGILIGFHVHLGPRGADTRLNHYTGPLTTVPVAEVDPALGEHLDSAERLLTEVNHTEGALPPAERAEAHTLLLRNAIYQRSAHDRGDLSSVAMLDDLGRVLTTIEMEPPTQTRRTLQLRMEMNTDGLLFQIRIVRQNSGQ